MHFIIDNKSKTETFVTIIQLLKNWGSYITMNFDESRLNIQSIDKSHICLANIEIMNEWFTEYVCADSHKITVDSAHFALLMKSALKNDKLELKYMSEIETDKLYINFLNEKENKESFNHFFELNLIELEDDNLEIPHIDYDAEFTLDAKKIVDVFIELNNIGEDLNIKCSENMIEFIVEGVSTKLKVNIPTDELDEYSITEENNIDVSFSLNHLCKMCLSMKISSKIYIGVSNDYPMVVEYSLGDKSKVSLYLAPKIRDDC